VSSAGKMSRLIPYEGWIDVFEDPLALVPLPVSDPVAVAYENKVLELVRDQARWYEARWPAPYGLERVELRGHRPDSAIVFWTDFPHRPRAAGYRIWEGRVQEVQPPFIHGPGEVANWAWRHFLDDELDELADQDLERLGPARAT